MPGAVVLCGGKGERLRETIGEHQKCAVPIHGRPFLARVLDLVVECGVREIVLSTGYRSEEVRAAVGFEWKGVPLEHCWEVEPLGTAQAALAGSRRLKKGYAVMVVNGDTFCDGDREALFVKHQRLHASGTVLSVYAPDRTRYGALVTRGNGVDRVERGNGTPGWIDAGTAIFTRSALDQFGSIRESLFDTLNALAVANELASHRVDARFVDIGTPEGYRFAHEILVK